jgi:hypothetical protein
MAKIFEKLIFGGLHEKHAALPKLDSISPTTAAPTSLNLKKKIEN